MKAFNFYQQINTPELCYNTVHMHGALSTVMDCSAATLQEASHLLLLDVPYSIDQHIHEFVNFRNEGGKVVLMTFDPFNFPRVDGYIQKNMLDMVVVFDVQFRNRFNVKTYVSDYFFNQAVYPTEIQEYVNYPCVFGHLMYGRENTHNVPKVDKGVSSYRELYTRVRSFNGVIVFDSGLDETGSSLVAYNKAKAVETLMCGRTPYCMPGINTIHYNRYLKKYEDALTPTNIDFSQETIFEINKQVLQSLQEQITNL